jgi:hypothetical protein
MKKDQDKLRATLVPELIENKIFLIRDKKVMIDRDLALLYGVETRALNQAVRRHKERFPEDFMFQLTREETENWKSQIVISNKEKMGIRKTPFVFTENGVAILSSVLNSKKAVHVNIQIMRTFTKLRELMYSHKELKQKIEDLERKFEQHDKNFIVIFEAIKKLLEPPAQPKKPIGFHP